MFLLLTALKRNGYKKETDTRKKRVYIGPHVKKKIGKIMGKYFSRLLSIISSSRCDVCQNRKIKTIFKKKDLHEEKSAIRIGFF